MDLAHGQRHALVALKYGLVHGIPVDRSGGAVEGGASLSGEYAKQAADGPSLQRMAEFIR